MRAKAGNDGLLSEISAFCRARSMAETTFGRAAINDGKLVSRLRDGGRITTQTLDRVRAFMGDDRRAGAGDAPVEAQPAARPPDPRANFRFFDNRQKYLLFVNTCGEKWTVANRVAMELANIHPRPPAF